MRPIEDNPVLLTIEQDDKWATLCVYANGVTWTAKIDLTIIGLWRAEISGSGTDTSPRAIVHSHREVCVHESRKIAAAWLAERLHNALRWPALSIAEHRMLDLVNDNLRGMFAQPGTWGGPEATELQALQAMEMRDAVLHPTHGARYILNSYHDFLRRVFPIGGSLPAFQILRQMDAECSEMELTVRVAKIMSEFDALLTLTDAC